MVSIFLEEIPCSAVNAQKLSPELQLLNFETKTSQTGSITELILGRNCTHILNNGSSLVLDRSLLRCFKKYLIRLLISQVSIFTARFVIIGYQYSIKVSSKNRYLRMKLGYRYKFFMSLPDSVYIFGSTKRGLFLGSANISILDSITRSLASLRHLYPYKKKGLVLASSEAIRLKVGKKTKYK